MVARFAVMGNPIGHSLSPLLHQHFARQTGCDLTYDTLLVEEGELTTQVADFFAQGGQGLNITAPFKEEAYALAHVRTPRCEKARAANTLWMQDGLLHADNTDGVGLLRDLARYRDVAGVHLLLLGAGGAARGVIGPLLAASPASVTVFNRTVEKACLLKEDFPQIRVVASLSGQASKPASGLQQQTMVDEPLIRRGATPSPRVRGEGKNERSYLEASKPASGLQQQTMVDEPLIRRGATPSPRVRGEGKNKARYLEEAFGVIINATTAGNHETFWSAALGGVSHLKSAFCYDLSYALLEPTAFVQWATARGCLAVDGLGMLVEQAAEAFFIWHGIFPDTAPVLALLRRKV